MDIVERLRFDAARCETQFSKGVALNIEEAATEIERLRDLLSQAMTLLHQMPIKHPQQARQRDDLAKRCGFTAQHVQS